jgi:hypothetical protein
MKTSSLNPMQLVIHESESWFDFYRELQLIFSSHIGTCGQFGPGAQNTN